MRQRVSPYFACNGTIRKDYKSRQWFPYLCFATSLLAALATACVDLRERVRLALVFQILLSLLLLFVFLLHLLPRLASTLGCHLFCQHLVKEVGPWEHTLSEEPWAVRLGEQQLFALLDATPDDVCLQRIVLRRSVPPREEITDFGIERSAAIKVRRASEVGHHWEAISSYCHVAMAVQAPFLRNGTEGVDTFAVHHWQFFPTTQNFDK